MIPSGDDVLAAAGGITTACAFVDAMRGHLSRSLDSLLERDRRDTPLPRRCVLVVDDDPLGLDTMERILEPLGVPVVMVSTTAEARVAIRRDRPAVVVADYHLCGETSVALLRDRPAFVRAVLVTGAVDLGALAQIARGCGADLRDRPVTDEAQRELAALVASYLPPEST